MHIIVPVKQVPETNAVRMDPETGTMVREGVEAIVNPLDLYSIESALRLKEACPTARVTVISMGPPTAARALREAIAMGADDGVLLSDKAFAGADTWSTAYVLASAIRKLGDVDLVLCGERATDGDTGQVGPGIAAFLDLPVATYVGRIQSVRAGTVRVHRLIEDGHEMLDVQTPAVLTVVKEVAEPRLPTLHGKRRSRECEIPVWSAADLDVDSEKLGLAGSPTRVVKIFRPQVTRECKLLTASDEASTQEACREVVGFLQCKELI